MSGLLEFPFTILPDGQEPFQVVAKSRDVAFYERTVKGASLQKLADNPTISELEHLAWLTANRRGKFPGTLEQFRETCDFDIDSSDDEPDPTTQTAP